jgi:tRNA threonylcarbamoyladenosine biosynthesis protein TsaE
MNFPQNKHVRTEDETAEYAKEFAGGLGSGEVISLNGNLGAGKTFFIKQVCSQWGIYNVNSPTFALVNEYLAAQKVYHFDFYRINNEAELIDIGFNDYLNDDEAIVFIEWGNLFRQVLPPKRIDINIELLPGTERRFEVNRNE